MINLLTSFYVSKYSSSLDNERTKELIDALLKNINSDIIEKIHLFVDDNDAIDLLNSLIENTNKVHIIGIRKKPIYSDYFDYILDKIPEGICMIANSDIYLESYDIKLLNLLNDNKHMYALTRHEYDKSCPLIHNYSGSHDCYIFNSKFLNKNIINEHTQFIQNLYGIETHIISTFYHNGFTVLNPCLQIKIVHLHKSQLRENTGNFKWIGLHRYGDSSQFLKSVWCIKPIIL